MTTLITGASGQLGRAFWERLRLRESILFANRADFDLVQTETLQKQLDEIRPSTIINCAAYTAVDAAEAHPDLAFRINSDSVGELSKWCAREEAFLVHFSTDYVFDGEKQGQYTEDDIANPLSVYGKSKRGGEEKFLESGCNGMCLRTSWLHSIHCENFFSKMLTLLKTRKDVKVVNDQTGVPTTAAFLVDLTLELLKSRADQRNRIAILNACPSGQATWYDFAHHILNRMMSEDMPITCKNIIPVSSKEFSQNAQRPKMSALSNSKVISMIPEFDIPWQVATNRIKLENSLWNTY